jgi:hypothetical protein
MRLAISVFLVAAAGCAVPSTAPSGVTIEGDASGQSSAVIVSISPAAGTTIASSVFTRVTVEYTLGRTAVDPHVWTCVGSTDSSVILSSCRDVKISTTAGVVDARPDIFYENGRRAVASTRYVAVFLVEGDIVERRVQVPQFELKTSDLTRYMLARQTIEHMWQWADMR